MRRSHLNLISAIILVAGLSSAVFTYRSAVNAQGEVLGYEVGSDGKIYPVLPEDSKAYQRSLEIYGGKANVLADEFRRWFAGLWQGKRLSYIIAFITVLTSAILFSIARHSSGNRKS